MGWVGKSNLAIGMKWGWDLPLKHGDGVVLEKRELPQRCFSRTWGWEPESMMMCPMVLLGGMFCFHWFWTWNFSPCRCDQYSPMCNKPAPDAGVSYCHRDASGVCDACHIPGTVRAVSPPSQVACRVDLFLNKELPQYKDLGYFGIPSGKHT